MSETTSYTYYPDGKQQTVTSPGGNVTTSIYDTADRLTGISDSVGVVAAYSYDANGNRLTSTDGNGFTSTNVYDAANRLVSVTDPMSQSTAYSYDDAGNQLTVTDRNSNTTSYTYDALNRRIMTTDALSNLTIHLYDPVGNLTMITDAKGNSTTYSYDALNRLLSETYADLTTRGFSYDVVGNMLTRTDQNGNTTAYIYDDLYRLTLRNYPGINDDSFTYDSAGSMLTAANANAAISYAYDNANRTLSETLNGKATSYIYDIPNRKRTLTYPGGKSVTEEMNLRQRLNNIKEGLNTIVLYSYDAGNRLVGRDYPMNTTTAAYTHNANNWTTNLTHLAGITPFTDFEYTFDNEGNRKYQKKFHYLTNSEQYLYDNIYRVTAYKEGTLNISGTIPAPLTQTAYNYDAVGNRTSTNKDATITTYTTNSVNEYTAIVSGGAVFPLYDLNGNLTNDGTRAFSFDYENRLTDVAPGAISYKYDPLGRRIEKNVAGTITRYYFDGSRVIEERDGLDVVAATYTFGSWIDEILTMDRSGNTYYYHQNSLGTVSAVTNSSGVIVERYEYDAYGETTILDPSFLFRLSSIISNQFMFTSGVFDMETGLYFYKTRYYDPKSGRFLQNEIGEDNIHLLAVNKYSYVENNPLNYKTNNGKVLLPNLSKEFEEVNGKTWCDINTGTMVTEIYNKKCTRVCTEEHESDHRNYRGPCCALFKTCYDNAGKDIGEQANCIEKYKNWIKETSAFSECRAYTVSVNCAERELKKCDCTLKDHAGGDHQIGEHYNKECCDIFKEYKGSVEKSKKENCDKAKDKACPF
ncbi:MAG: RHS repeat protein [Nitrospirae bacterium]|nr:RHS repeat protein [Nitrospirota bacterium]